jgi:hypothetical protein
LLVDLLIVAPRRCSRSDLLRVERARTAFAFALPPPIYFLARAASAASAPPPPPAMFFIATDLQSNRKYPIREAFSFQLAHLAPHFRLPALSLEGL